MYQEINITNVLNPDSIKQILDQLERCEQENVRFVVLKGAEKVFCNGLDIAWVVNGEESKFAQAMNLYATCLKKLQVGKFISVALVNGTVAGGGMGLVCACDFVIAEESSTFSLPEGLLGLIPGMILPALLNRLSPQCIKKMVFTGKKYSASTAIEFGIVDEISNNHSKALNNAVNTMRSCKTTAVGDIKEILYTFHSNNDELALQGMINLRAKLQDPEINQRLQDIAEML